MPRIIIDIEDEQDLEFLRSESAKAGQTPADCLRSWVLNGLLSSPRCLDDSARTKPRRNRRLNKCADTGYGVFVHTVGV